MSVILQRCSRVALVAGVVALASAAALRGQQPMTRGQIQQRRDSAAAGSLTTPAPAAIVEFGRPTPLELNWDPADSIGRRIQLISHSAKTLGVHIRVVDAEGLPASELVTISPASLTMQPRGVSVITVQFKRTKGMKQGVYAGEIIALVASPAELAGTLVRRTITVSNPPVPPVPRVKTWAAVANVSPFAQFRGQSRHRLTYGRYLPARVVGADNAPFTPLSFLGVLRDSVRGDALWVGVEGTRRPLSSDMIGVELMTNGIARVGDYRGQIDFDPDRTGDEVDMRLRVRHPWQYAALLLLIGVLVAIWLEFYVGVGRRLVDIRSRLVNLNILIDKYTGPVNAMKHGTRIQVTDAPQKLVALATELRKATLPALTQQSKEIEDVENDVEQVEQQTRRLPELAILAGQLKTELDAMPVEATRDLVLKKEAEALTKPIQLAEITSRVDEMKPAVSQLAAWRARFQTVTRIQSDKLPDAFKARVFLISSALFSADLKGFDAVALDTGIVQLKEDLAKAGVQLEAKPDQPAQKDPAAQVRKTPADSGAVPAPGMQRRMQMGGFYVAEPFARFLRWVKARYTLGEVSFFVITVTIAVLTGMNQLYFGGNAFGAPQDYIAALLWGVGAKTGFDLLRSAITKFGLRLS